MEQYCLYYIDNGTATHCGHHDLSAEEAELANSIDDGYVYMKRELDYVRDNGDEVWCCPRP